MKDMDLPQNETVLDYAPGSRERLLLEQQLARMASEETFMPLWIGERVSGKRPVKDVHAPHDHGLCLGKVAQASSTDVERAVLVALEARAGWSSATFETRARVFLKAAELTSGPFRARLNAATMLGQSKTAHQAEIDAAAELADFFRFNVAYLAQLEQHPLVSPQGTLNLFELRPLEGFVYAVSPFNFTSIAANLPAAPALMGNTVIWKPSALSPLSAHVIMELFHAAGLPEGVITLLHGDPSQISDLLLAHPSFAGLHFTGGTEVMRHLWRNVADALDRHTTFPRLVGETGGKNFVVAHPSADLDSLAVAVLRGAFEYQGQKCSAASRLYVPSSLFPRLISRLENMMAQIKVGDIRDFSNFMGAVIGRQAFDRIVGYQRLAKEDPACEVLAGGDADDTQGFFVSPTLIRTRDPRHRLMTEEIFGPICTCFEYADDRFEQILELCDQTSPYGLTGAIFAQERPAIDQALSALRFSAGNFYINDKPTGAVVGQQPFGGGRLSGTNDKAGSYLNLLRWTSPRVIKENFSPPTDWRYPFMG